MTSQVRPHQSASIRKRLIVRSDSCMLWLRVTDVHGRHPGTRPRQRSAGLHLGQAISVRANSARAERPASPRQGGTISRLSNRSSPTSFFVVTGISRFDLIRSFQSTLKLGPTICHHYGMTEQDLSQSRKRQRHRRTAIGSRRKIARLTREWPFPRAGSAKATAHSNRA